MSLAEKPLLTVQGMTGAAVFGALSAVIAFITAPYLPRIPAWGIAWFDPVSIIWVICFFIFGAAAGILCCFIGTVALMFVDPWVPIGPIMKLAATLPMILIPFIILKLKKDWKYSSEELKGKKIITMTIVSIIVRFLMMFGANILVFIFMFGGIESAMPLWGLDGIWVILVVVLVINTLQGVWDILIPWLIVYPTKIYQYASW
ncbi:MAG: ECF transporter S component [Candidatus Helarchaeota archaeon]